MTAPSTQDMGELLTTVRVPCLVCKKILTFSNMKRHVKTVHGGEGKKWACNVCGKIAQSESRLTKHQRIHMAETNDREENIFNCADCEYRTLCKDYLVDHRRLMHTTTSHGQFICVVGKCFEKPLTFPNKARLEKHKSCHENKKCSSCGKLFGSTRNLKRHQRNKHDKDQNQSTNLNNNNGDNNGNTPF